MTSPRRHSNDEFDISNLDNIFLNQVFFGEEYPDIPNTKVFFNNRAIPFYEENKESVLNTYQSKEGIWVLDNEHFFMAPQNIVHHHSDFNQGKPIICAGQYILNSKGKIKLLSNDSGHYTPNYGCLNEVDDFIRDSGYQGTLTYKLISQITDTFGQPILRSKIVRTSNRTDYL